MKKQPERPAVWYSVPTGRTVADEWHAADDVARREMLAEHGVVVRLFPRRRMVKQGGVNHPTGFEITVEIDHDPADEISEPPMGGEPSVPGSRLRIHEPAKAA
ncbi:hypothetical protein [Kitasatospora sp. NPDC058218]|uniref:hypothetical protein n=1 Tax=Kitasatospora sp. NPDC058218 TaxID=3346385 RepID=UPI0036D97398